MQANDHADNQAEEGFLSDNGSDDWFEPNDVYGNQNHQNLEDPIMEGIRRNVPLQAIYAIINSTLVAIGKIEKQGSYLHQLPHIHVTGHL